jgi:hypothetical protein
MRIWTKLLVLGLLLMAFRVRAQMSDEEVRRYFIKMAQKSANVDAEAILNQTPAKEIMPYVRGRTPLKLEESYGTVVHESCHGLNFAKSHFGTKGYYIGGEAFVVCKRTEVYPSKELDRVSWWKNKQNFSRYDTYIGKAEKILGSNIHGIYGLLEEFCAYYHGTNAEFLWLETNQFSPGLVAENRSSNVANSYYEFLVFMARYLEYSKQKYPQQYLKIIENQNFKIAFTLLHQRFEALIKSIRASRFKNNFSFSNEKDLTDKEWNWLKVLIVPETDFSNYASKLEEANQKESKNTASSLSDLKEQASSSVQFHVVSQGFASREKAESFKDSIAESLNITYDGKKSTAKVIEDRGKFYVSVFQSDDKESAEMILKTINDAYKAHHVFGILKK